MFQGHRSNDAVITICQDNDRKSIEIRGLNKPAEDALGYPVAEVSGQPLVRFLPSRIQTLLSEYVEYENDGNDVGNVLSKVQSFCVVNQQGREVAFRLKVLRSESLDKNAYFRLILQDRVGVRKEEAFRSILRDNFRGHEVLDPNTGLPDRNSLVKDLELVQHYVGKEALKSCVAVLEVDHCDDIRDKHGDTVCFALLKHFAFIAKQNLRTDDTICYTGPKQLGIILMDTNMESARMVLNRLRWLMAATPIPLSNTETLPVTVSIAFTNVGASTGHAPDKNLIDLLEEALSAQQNPAGNSMVEVTEQAE